MRARDFKTFNTEVQDISRLQDNVSEVLKPLTDRPLNGHALLQSIVVQTTPTAVAHKLGSEFQGWMVASINAPETVYEISRNKTTLTLQATGIVTINLVVF